MAITVNRTDAYRDSVSALRAALDWNAIHGSRHKIARADVIDGKWYVGIYHLSIDKMLAPTADESLIMAPTI